MTDFLLMVGGALFAMFISGIINYKKSKWVGLTDDEISEVAVKSQDGISPHDDTLRFARAIESKLKEKNELR